MLDSRRDMGECSGTSKILIKDVGSGRFASPTRFSHMYLLYLHHIVTTDVDAAWKGHAM